MFVSADSPSACCCTYVIAVESTDRLNILKRNPTQRVEYRENIIHRKREGRNMPYIRVWPKKSYQNCIFEVLYGSNKDHKQT